MERHSGKSEEKYAEDVAEGIRELCGLPLEEYDDMRVGEAEDLAAWASRVRGRLAVMRYAAEALREG